MSSITMTVHIPRHLQEWYDQLAQTTGQTRDHLVAEALERYATQEEWQRVQTRAALARLEEGTLETIDLDDLIVADLASGEITQEDLKEAYARYGVEP